VGGARTALFNWLLARRFDGKFLLRIEDTDRARGSDESTRAIFEGLEWLDLNWDEDVVFQGANLMRHQEDAARLLTNGTAYPCFCTTTELDARRREAESARAAFRYDRRCYHLAPDEVKARVAAGEPHTLRFFVPDGSTDWDDLVHGTISFPNKDIEDFVVLRSDATPIYNMAVVSDDIAMRITVVMRGDDHISNTPKQIMLYRALGSSLPWFAHLPMIHGTDGKKLSKRHGATAVGDYRHEGILPGAMANFLALLGWSPGGDREIMTLDEMISLFSLEGLLRKAAIFDPRKLEWMNGQHLSLVPLQEIEPSVTDAIVEAGLATRAELDARRAWYFDLVALLRVRARRIGDIVRQARPYFADDIGYDPDAVANQWKDRDATRDILAATFARLEKLETWDAVALESQLRALSIELGIAAGKIFQPMRVALTGLAVSPGIFEVLIMLGREKSLRRIAAAIDFLRSTA
jgi:glutamyl-tRNA synthetase